MLSRNELPDINVFLTMDLPDLATLSFFSNSIATPTNSKQDFLKFLETIAKSCPNVKLLNIEGNPLIDAQVLAETDN